MRWELLSSIILDSRILILLVLVIVTILISIVLIIIDKNSKSKEKKEQETDIINERIKNIKRILESLKNPEERLGAINQKAKELFKEVFDIDTSKNYSYLINYFNEKKLTRYSSFCQDMFNIYYSIDMLSNIDVDNIEKKFISLIELSREHILNNLRKNKNPQKNNSYNKISISKTMNKNITTKPQIISSVDIKKSISNKMPIDKKDFLTPEQNDMMDSINKKRIQLDFQERKNIELLKETEERLKQQQKIENELKEKLETQKKKQEIIEKNLTRTKISQTKNITNETESCHINKRWYHDVNTEPIQGKDWVKKMKKKKRNNK